MKAPKPPNAAVLSVTTFYTFLYEFSPFSFDS